MTAEDYGKAVEAGQVTHEQAQQISAAVEQMMNSDDVKAKLEAAVAEQIDALVEQNLADESVQKQLEEAIAPAKPVMMRSIPSKRSWIPSIRL